jgi:putative salt-induced outer membrane protein YdiY
MTREFGRTRVCVRPGSTKLIVLAAMAVTAWGARASAQEDAIPDDIAADVGGSGTKSAGEATFTAPPPEQEGSTSETTSESPEEEAKAEVDWSLNAGGAINTGNTRSWNLNAGTNFELLKKEHHLTIGALFNFGRADATPTDPTTGYSTVSRQLFFNSRYEYFFADKDAVWAALGYRWDPLAGFRAQLLANVGYLRAFIKTDKHYFAGRVGYSYTFENYEVPPSMLTDNSNIHGLLAALDYENRLNEHVEFLSSITTIYNLNEIAVQNAMPFQDIRIYLTAALLSKLTDQLAFEARFLMLYDRLPAGADLMKTDTTTIFSLVYTLL